MRTLVAVVAAVLIGVVALPFAFGVVMSELADVETEVADAVILAALFVGGGLLVGWLAGRRWRLAVICAWAPVLMGVYWLSVSLWSWLLFAALVPGSVVASLFGGFLGHRLAERRVREADSVRARPAA